MRVEGLTALALISTVVAVLGQGCTQAHSLTISAPIVTLPANRCPPVDFHKENGSVGDRAVISATGDAFVLQCGDGDVLAWREGERKGRSLGNVRLFVAAQRERLLPEELKCDWPKMFRASLNSEPDCDVVDRSDDGGTFVLSQGPGESSVVSLNGIWKDLSVFQQPGMLWPRHEPNSVIVGDAEHESPELHQLNLATGERRSLHKFTARNLIFEGSEGQPNDVRYAPKHNLILVSFDGVFRVADRMTYLRALTPEGNEKWHIEGALPARTTDDFVGEFPKLTVLSNGEYALLNLREAKRTLALDVSDGLEIGRLDGKPIAASTGGTRVLTRLPNGDVAYVELSIH